jgi:hypothetical protein
MRVSIAVFVAAICLSNVSARADTLAAPSQPRIINGAPVDVGTQRSRGLVTVNGGCSGTMLTHKWLITADHCITTNGQVGGPATALASLAITATWSATTARPRQYVRFSGAPNNLDIALVELGDVDLGGPVRALPELDTGALVATASVQKYGQGFSFFARQDPGPPPVDVPSGGSGTYRQAVFAASNIVASSYQLQTNGNNQVGAAGDSGSSDWMLRAGGAPLMVGIQTTCNRAGCLAGHICNVNDPWTWATGISFCTSGRVSPIRDDIIRAACDQKANTLRPPTFLNPRWRCVPRSIQSFQVIDLLLLAD